VSQDSSGPIADAISPVDPETARRFYVNGVWVEPHGTQTRDVINPATEETIATIALGDSVDVDRAVAVARRAFETFSVTTPQDRADLLAAVIAVDERRVDDIADAVRQEVGAPIRIARRAQAPIGLGHLQATLASLQDFAWEETIGTTTVTHEPIGVCGFITRGTGR
jgi:aldehyde dehydrogenase (NAD+)